ncbi:MAG: hypothetical protein ACXWKY_16775, partial [Caulobacteraceae bacterium]
FSGRTLPAILILPVAQCCSCAAVQMESRVASSPLFVYEHRQLPDRINTVLELLLTGPGHTENSIFRI